MYSKPQTPSRPEPREREPSRWRRTLLWFAGVVAFLIAAAYAIGGRGLFRRLLQMRSRAAASIEATLQPPTQAEMQRAAAQDTASVMPNTGPAPASIWFIVIFIAAIILAAVTTFYVSGRRPRQRS